MSRKELLFVFLVVGVLILPTVFASLVGYTVTGTISTSEGSLAKNARVTLHSTAYGAFGESFRCNCSANMPDYSSRSGIYTSAVDNLVADYDCPTGISKGNSCASYISSDKDFVWVTVDGSTVPSVEGNGSLPYSTLWEDYSSSGTVYNKLDISLDQGPEPSSSSSSQDSSNGSVSLNNSESQEVSNTSVKFRVEETKKVGDKEVEEVTNSVEKSKKLSGGSVSNKSAKLSAISTGSKTKTSGTNNSINSSTENSKMAKSSLLFNSIITFLIVLVMFLVVSFFVTRRSKKK